MSGPRWHSVNDCLPEPDVPVLVCHDGGNSDVNHAWYDRELTGFRDIGSAAIIVDVTHWMPMPTPPVR